MLVSIPIQSTWQCVDWQKLQILKGRKSAFGALITSPRSQIIWGSRDRDPVVLVIEVGEPCYDSTGEEYASNHFCYKTNSRPLRDPPVSRMETPIAVRGAPAFDVSDGFFELPESRYNRAPIISPPISLGSDSDHEEIQRSSQDGSHL